MKLWSILALGTFLLVGCFHDEEESLPYPPLDPRALVGCWTEGQPYSFCTTNCFDRSGGFYSAMTFTTRGKELGEDSGSYYIQTNHAILSSRIKTTTGKDSPNNGQLLLTIVNDTLFTTDPFRADFYTRVHPDSFPCGLKPWTLFRKPAGWDSLIKPY